MSARLLAFANGVQPQAPAPLQKSLSESRALAASLWVEKEVEKLIDEIEKLGKQSGNVKEITFGELFLHYQDVSDTLVGILQRAKKRGILKYEGSGGDLLLQRKHDHVVIQMDLSKAAAWKKEYQAGAAKKQAELLSNPNPVASAETAKNQPKTITKPDSSAALKPSAIAASTPQTTSTAAARAKPAPVTTKVIAPVRPSSRPPVKKTAPGLTPVKGTSESNVPMPVVYCLAILIIFVLWFIVTTFLRMIFFRR